MLISVDHGFRNLYQMSKWVSSSSNISQDIINGIKEVDILYFKAHI